MMGTDDKPWLTIVGIVGNVRHNAVVEEPRAEMYLAHAQLPAHIRSAPRGMTLVVKTDGNPLALTGQVRDAIRAIDRNLPVSDIRTMEQVTASALSQPRFVTFLLALFAAPRSRWRRSASTERSRCWSPSARRRWAFASRSARIGRPSSSWCSGQGMVLTAIGLAIGLAGAAVLTRTLSGLIYGVGTLDPLTFVAVPALLCAVALLACFLPARRAASVDPITTLRQVVIR